MQEIIDALEKSFSVNYLIDTCFLIHMLENNQAHHLLRFCQSKRAGISSFNLEELNKIHHKLERNVKHRLRTFLKEKAVCCVPVEVRPGEWTAERNYVRGFDDKLLKTVPDASDAVLLVLALKIKANVLTRDKHHIFTTQAENYLKYYGIEVLNSLPDT